MTLTFPVSYAVQQPLAPLSSMKTGGCADYLLLPKNSGEIVTAIQAVKAYSLPLHILGYASNVLIPDEGIRGGVVMTSSAKLTRRVENSELADLPDPIDQDGTDHVQYWYCECGASLTGLAGKLSKNGLAGLEFAYGIPGTVGGAVYMNAGAYGGEIQDVVKAVRYYDVGRDTVGLLNASQLDFRYRHSIFSDRPDWIVLGAYFALIPADPAETARKSEEFMSARKAKQPLDFPSCGSVFKRPAGHYAGKLIEDAGLKGLRVGGACVSEKHAGFIINTGNATTGDVLTLVQKIKDAVCQTYGVTLEMEIKVLTNDT